MVLRAAGPIAIALIGISTSAGESYAQSHPPEAYPRSPVYHAPSLDQAASPYYAGQAVPQQRHIYGSPHGGSAAGAEAEDEVNPGETVRVDPRSMAALPADVRPETGQRKELPQELRRTLVDYPTKASAGTIVVDTPNTYLYLVLGNGKALRYGIGVGREGFKWAGEEKISRIEWRHGLIGTRRSK
jgi:lipoprotein-anchoring transpeptidase ErfK/SrfK